MSDWQKNYALTPDDPPNDGIMFVNHEPNDRSGHMGHALVEYAPGRILAFYPNCSSRDARLKGHSGDGWMEYRRSTDSGLTWSEPVIEPNSKALYDSSCGRSQMCEKAICADDGSIILFYLTCDIVTNGHGWEPYFEPYYAVSNDGGESWSETRMFAHEAGRIYDVVKHDGIIYVLFFANAELPGIAHLQEHPYKLFRSCDNGKSFEYVSTVGFDSTIHCLYGTMSFMDDGRLIVYIYDELDEHNPKYIISDDNGKTWGANRRAFFEKKIRNPQLVEYDGTWFMHGRSGSFGSDAGHFVLYSSKDGVNWDEGCYLRFATQGYGAYSNNLVVHSPDGHDRLLIQTSHAYYQNRTNTIMWWLDKKTV